MKTKKTCLDCLNCKVSAKSTDKCRLCFCSQTKNKERHKENYWLDKKLCDEFEDMSENKAYTLVFPIVPLKRHPLLRKREY